MTGPPVQHTYARWLEWGTRAGLALLASSFVVYAFEMLDPLVPHARLAEIWHLPIEYFVAASGAPTGWGWLARLDKGDYLTLLGVALLGMTSAVCYARVLVVFMRRGERLQAAVAAAQVAVLLAAASGFLAGGH